MAASSSRLGQPNPFAPDSTDSYIEPESPLALARQGKRRADEDQHVPSPRGAKRRGPRHANDPLSDLEIEVLFNNEIGEPVVRHRNTLQALLMYGNENQLHNVRLDTSTSRSTCEYRWDALLADLKQAGLQLPADGLRFTLALVGGSGNPTTFDEMEISGFGLWNIALKRLKSYLLLGDDEDPLPDTPTIRLRSHVPLVQIAAARTPAAAVVDLRPESRPADLALRTPPSPPPAAEQLSSAELPSRGEQGEQDEPMHGDGEEAPPSQVEMAMPGAAPPAQLDSEAQPGSSSQDAIVVDDEEAAGDDGASAGVSLLAALAWPEAADLELWEPTCRFFLHDPAANNHDKVTHKLLGCTLPLKIYQLIDVYALAVRCVDEKATDRSKRINGQLLTHRMGVGKTVEALVFAAVHRLAILNRKHVGRFPRAHLDMNSQRAGLTCPSGNPFGIECYCVQGSMTYKLVECREHGQSIAFLPSNLVEQWVYVGRALFEPSVRVSWPSPSINSAELSMEDSIRYHFITVVDGKKGIPSKVKESLDAKAEGLFTEGGEMIKSLAKASRLSVTKAMPLAHAIKDKIIPGGSAPKFRPSVDQTSAAYRFVIAVSVSQARMPLWMDMFSDEIEYEVGKTRPFKVTVTSAYSCGLTFVDEFHTVKENNTMTSRLYHSFIRNRQPAYRSFFLFLSGTPINEGPQNLTVPMSIIYGGKYSHAEIKAWLDRTRQRHVAAMKSRPMLARGSSDDDAARNSWVQETWEPLAKDFQGMIGPVTIRRSEGDKLFGHDLMRLKEKHTREVDCAVPAEYEERLDDFSRSARLRLATELKKTLSGQAGQGHHANAPRGSIREGKTFNELDRVVHFPALLSLSAKELDEMAWTVEHLKERFKGVKYPKDGLERPARYLVPGVVQESIMSRLPDIVRFSPRMQELFAICRSAQRDEEVPDGSLFKPRPKHVIVFCKSPIIAFLTQLCLEHQLENVEADSRVFSPALYSSSMPTKLRQAVHSWFALPHEEGASKVLVTTYRLLSTGIDSLKAANYCVHLDQNLDPAETEQADARVHRQGQTLTARIINMFSKGTLTYHVANHRRSFRSSVSHSSNDSILEVIRALDGGGQAGLEA